MPGPKDPLPEFKKGEILTAAQLNQVLDAIKARLPAAPGAYVGGSFTVHRPLNTGIDEYEVAITKTIPGCTWDKAKRKKVWVSCSFPVWSGHADGDGDTFEDSAKAEFFSKFGKSVDVSEGKFRVGTVVNDILMNVDCEEFDLPDDFNE